MDSLIYKPTSESINSLFKVTGCMEWLLFINRNYLWFLFVNLHVPRILLDTEDTTVIEKEKENVAFVEVIFKVNVRIWII